MSTSHTFIRDWGGDAPVDGIVLVRELDRREKRDGSPFLRDA